MLLLLDPLELDPDKAGVASDHLTVVMSPIGSLNDMKTRLKKKIEFRPLNDQGFNEMGNKFRSFDWAQNNLCSIFTE